MKEFIIKEQQLNSVIALINEGKFNDVQVKTIVTILNILNTLPEKESKKPKKQEK